jgi:hypothetical protein
MTKKIAVALAVAGIAATATVAFAGPNAGTGLNGSAHDLNVSGTVYRGDSLGRSCVFCHTPHNALKANNDYAPLWNHADNDSQKLATFKAYQWVSPANMKITSMNIDDPLVGPSRLCMACHDGSTAVDAHGSAHGTTTNGTNMHNSQTASYWDSVLKQNATRYISDLQVTHPIGFKYQEAVTIRQGELVDKSSRFIDYDIDGATWNTHNRGDHSSSTAKRIQDTLYGLDANGNGYMTCASCHDVHNSVNVSDSQNTYNYFLYAKEEGSAICLSCHIK